MPVIGNGISVLGEETWITFPLSGVGDPLNGIMSVGIGQLNIASVIQTIANTSVIKTGSLGSQVIAVVPADIASRTAFANGGFYSTWQDDVHGVSFRINMANIPASAGFFFYWLLHPKQHVGAP